jgi:Exodeoxyribonuclease X-like C-terminal
LSRAVQSIEDRLAARFHYRHLYAHATENKLVTATAGEPSKNLHRNGRENMMSSNIIPFGKHKGRTIEEVLIDDPNAE